jgi:hypothetical protein
MKPRNGQQISDGAKTSNTFITSRVFSLVGCTKQRVGKQQESTLALTSFNSCIIHFYPLPLHNIDRHQL